MPTSTLHTTEHWEWSQSTNLTWLMIGFVLVVGWVCWQLIREARLTQRRGCWVFIPFRLVIAGLLFWMLLGPTTVIVHKEIRPRVIPVFLDTSSSMLTKDQADPISERRWKVPQSGTPDALQSADLLAMYAGALRQEAANLIRHIAQQAPLEVRNSSATKWQQLSHACQRELQSLINHKQISGETLRELTELQSQLKSELQPIFAATDWMHGRDPGDREERLSRLIDQGSQFAQRCRNFWYTLHSEMVGIASTNSAPNSSTAKRLELVTPVLDHSLSQWQQDARDNYQIHVAQFDERISESSLETWKSSVQTVLESESAGIRRTNLVQLMEHIRDESSNQDVSAAVIITDGRQTVRAQQNLRDLAAQFRIPLYFVPIGQTEMQRDVILHHLHAPPSVIQNDTILIEGLVTAHHYTGSTCTVQLLENETVIETRQIQFAHDQDDQRIHFEVPTEQTGHREFKIQISQLPDEFSAENNADALAVDVVDATFRILLADDRARWEHQFLVNLFRRQERVEFDQLKFSPRTLGTGQRAANNSFPETVDEWSKYRVVILGDLGPRQLTLKSQQALSEYVIQRGGCLVILAGQNNMPHSFAGEPLAELLPVDASPQFQPATRGYRIEMTPEGKSLDALRLADQLVETESIWRRVNDSLPLYFLSNYHVPKTESHVLLSAVPQDASAKPGGDPAFLAWHQIGAGRVAFFSAPATYHLRILNGDQYHHRFWGQFLRWFITRTALSGSKSVRIQADQSHYTLGDAAQITVELSDIQGQPVSQASPVLQVLRDGKSIQTLPLRPDGQVPGRYLAQFEAETAERFQVQVQGPQVEQLLAAENYTKPVEIEINFEPGLDREVLDLRADRPLLEQLAEQSGGLVVEPTALPELNKVFAVEPLTRETQQRFPLWDRWWCLWCIVICLTTEWLLRKKMGLA